MAISTLFDAPFYTGSAVTSEVPGLFPVALNGRSYILDLKSGQFVRSSIPILRGQADVDNLPGEQSVNPEDLWRRSQETWHGGAGQAYLDRVTGQSVFNRTFSDPARFRNSKGIDPWTKWQLGLLADTANRRTSANTNLALAMAGTRLYLTDGTTLAYTTDITVGSPTFTAVTGTPGAATSIASDGYSVYSAHGASGIYLTNRSTGAAASWITGTVTLVRYLKGRLMAAAANSLYNVTTSTATAGPTALPAALLTHGNPDFAWVDCCEGGGVIYAGGFSGDKSLIYRITIRSDGTALDAPVVAGELPDGEILRSMQGYLGFVVLGTDRGVRFCTADGTGNLTVGPLLGTGTVSVGCFEGQDSFVWFGWTNYDSSSSGLGRMDLKTFSSPMAPAFASDLMATGQGAVTSVATFQSIRVFCVSGLGTFAETTTKVASGTLESGLFTYGINDDKIAMYADVRTEPLAAGSYEVFLATDGGTFSSLGTNSLATSDGFTFPANQSQGSRFEVRLKLVASGTTSPTVVRTTLRAYPAPNRGQTWTLPILLHETVTANGGVPRPVEVREELNLIIALITDKRLVTYQEGEESHAVFCEDFAWTPHHPTADNTFWNGICLLKIKEVSS